jgi:predicted nucleic acid-binding Zn ribbon protein
VRTNIPRPISDLLDQVVSGLGIKGSLDEARAIEAWAELSGPSIISVTDSVWMRRGKLYVKVTSSTWRQELHLQRQDWRDRINSHVGADLVKEVVFR